MATGASFHLHGFSAAPSAGATADDPVVSVLLVDTDRVTRPIDRRIYGQFLEHINHSVEDGLFAEQIRGAGFEGNDFETYWHSSAEHGQVDIANIAFQNGAKCVRLRVDGGHASIRQGRLFLDAGVQYEGSLWLKRETRSPDIKLQFKTAKGEPIASIPLLARLLRLAAGSIRIHQRSARHSGVD
ncbi:MAG TPA: hypothetical protein VGJ21_11690 [Terracidiphilus sp.]|jgi:alpha-N-arabinofuranosidase